MIPASRHTSLRPFRWPMLPNLSATNAHQRMACRYLGGALTSVVLAASVGGAAWLLLYPAVSCVAVACAYGASRPELLPKNPRLTSPWLTVLFAPYLLGAWCSWRCYALKVSAWDPVTANVLIGRRLHESEATGLQRCGVSAVLDLAPELPASRGLDAIEYRHVPMLDLVPPSQEQLQAALEFIQEQPPDSKLLIHCALGYTRSAIVAAAYLIRQGEPVHRALAKVRAGRNGIVLNQEMLEALQEFKRENQPSIISTDVKISSEIFH